VSNAPSGIGRTIAAMTIQELIDKLETPVRRSRSSSRTKTKNCSGRSGSSPSASAPKAIRRGGTTMTIRSPLFLSPKVPEAEQD
jgi:hypothetical protein